MSEIERMTARIREFARERDWEQFHTPKNLVMALAGEVGELSEHFQWLTDTEVSQLSPERLRRVEEEVADIQIYLMRLADRLKISLAEAVEKKIEINRKKYPIEKAKGSARKYNELES